MGGHPPPRFLCYLHLPRWRGDRVGNSGSKIPKQDLNVGWMFESLTHLNHLRILNMLSSMKIIYENACVLSTCILPPQIPTWQRIGAGGLGGWWCASGGPRCGH